MALVGVDNVGHFAAIFFDGGHDPGMAGVMPFSGVIGFLTPMLVDHWSRGNPGRAGRAYAINVLGCILGPLVAGFLFLPWFGERVSMLIFILPFFAIAVFPSLFSVSRAKLRPAVRAGAFAIVAAAVAVFFVAKDFETLFSNRIVLRDSAATVIATGRPGSFASFTSWMALGGNASEGWV